MNIKEISNRHFFFKPAAAKSSVHPVAQRLISTAQSLQRSGINLSVSATALPTRLSTLTAERVLELIPQDRIANTFAIVEFMNHLGTEISPGNYNLSELAAEVAKLPGYIDVNNLTFQNLERFAQKGIRFSDMPSNSREALSSLLEISKKVKIAPEYLLGNLQKATRLMELLHVRRKTINLSTHFSNFQNGYVEIGSAEPLRSTSEELLDRARALDDSGTTFEIYKGSEFRKKFIDLNAGELDSILSDSDGDFKRFIDATLTSEEQRLSSAPELSTINMFTFFKFDKSESKTVSTPPAQQLDNPLRWTKTDLGEALRTMQEGISREAVSVGVIQAGDFEALKTNTDICQKIAQLRDLAGNHGITLPTAKGRKIIHEKMGGLTDDQILFDLYCLSVLKKEGFEHVIDVAIDILQTLKKIENPAPQFHLDEFVSAKLNGEPYYTLFGTQGVVLTNSPIVSALEKLRSLNANLVINVDGNSKPIRDISIADFRRAIIYMGTTFREPHSIQRILAVLEYNVVPEISNLPPKVIDQSRSHDLGQIVEMAIAGIPARYPLRRPWTRISLDNLAFIGSGLEPGIRNCLGCPINAFLGIIIKTAKAFGFDEVLKYEATGCHEVYTGIYPYTGNTLPTLHGVFGGTPSEMLGGLAAKEARLKYARKTAAEIAETLKVLHFGVGGDGGTFDIGFGNLSGLFSRLQKLVGPEYGGQLVQRALYVCYDNEGYQNTGNQFSAATSPGGNTTTYPQGSARPLGSDLRKKPVVEILAAHGIGLSARVNIHRPEHISRVTARALEDGENGAFLHILQPCTTGWKFSADSIAYDLSYMAEEGAIFPPLTIEHGVPYLDMYPTPRNPERAFLDMQARFKHLTGSGQIAKDNLAILLDYYRSEWERNLRLAGFNGEIPGANRFNYLESEHRQPKINV